MLSFQQYAEIYSRFAPPPRAPQPQGTVNDAFNRALLKFSPPDAIGMRLHHEVHPVQDDKFDAFDFRWVYAKEPSR